MLLPGAQGGFVGDPTSLARDNIYLSSPTFAYIKQQTTTVPNWRVHSDSNASISVFSKLFEREITGGLQCSQEDSLSLHSNLLSRLQKCLPNIRHKFNLHLVLCIYMSSYMTCVVRKLTSLWLKREVHSSLCYNDCPMSVFSS